MPKQLSSHQGSLSGDATWAAQAQSQWVVSTIVIIVIIVIIVNSMTAIINTIIILITTIILIINIGPFSDGAPVNLSERDLKSLVERRQIGIFAKKVFKLKMRLKHPHFRKKFIKFRMCIKIKNVSSNFPPNFLFFFKCIN